jgi:hypothetical protein
MAKAAVLKKLAAAALTPKRGGHSPLYRAMWRDYEDVAPLFNRPRPNWEQIAKVYAEAGALDGDGKPAMAATARRTWRKVCRDKGREGLATKPVPGERLAVSHTAPAAHPTPHQRPAAEPPHEIEHAKPEGPRFGLARARGFIPRNQ